MLLRLTVILSLCFASTAYANSVQNCKLVVEAATKTAPEKKFNRCIVALTGGRIGDIVEIKNEYNYIVAVGKIIKKDGRYAVIMIGRSDKPIKTGYPVFLRNTDDPDFWTATTAPF